MSRATSKMRDFARRLIADETRRSMSSGSDSATVGDAIEKLRPHLTTLMGNTGFRALLSRSLALAQAEVRWLRVVHVKGDGSLTGLDAGAQINPKEITEGQIALLAQLLGLLAAFIGENLTLQMVREIWPELSLDDLNFDEGDKK
jgi:hypothetical protein